MGSNWNEGGNMDRILIVDDNKVNRQVLSNILKDSFEILEAESGKEALRILFEDHMDVSAMLLDVIMPEMDGFEVLKQVRSEEGYQDFPVIIQTENTEDVFEMNALKLGATDFVTKPYKPGSIRTRVQNIVNTRKMLNQVSRLSVDKLTGLMSLNQFYIEGRKWLDENKDSEFDVVALDISNFSVINDSKGVEGGDELIKGISEAIKQAQKDIPFFASRVYADRFVMLLRRRDGYRDRLIEEADKITQKYYSYMNVHIKFGIYEIIDRNEKLPSVCGRAFSATGLIKDYYGNKYVFYDEQLHQNLLFEEFINDEMENALKTNQFKVYYQPKYDLFTNAIAGAEALVRWEHPEKGMISPGQFIPLFEKNGFIVQLDRYVWRTTASRIAQWYQTGEKVIPVSVNISRIDIEMSDVIKVLCDIIDEYQIEPELLHLEITESAYMLNTDKIIDVVGKLKEKGFMIEMDDFGSGYSSLNMLAKLPINILKLDMKFIQEIENSLNAKTIIEYTIGLAKWLNLPVIAEGVETEEQLELLKQLKCNYVQGYIFAKPMREEEFRELLKSSVSSNLSVNNGTSNLSVYNAGKKNCMLIVEDLEMNRSIIRSYFEDTFMIVEASNGKQAWDYLKSGQRADIILLDIYMPEMDGYEFLDRVKHTEDLKKIPILVISSRNDEVQDKKLYELGADAFLSKPFTAERVISRVRLLMRTYSVMHDLDVWELRDTIENPWLREMCDEIKLIRISTQKICRVKGEIINDTADTYESLFSKETFLKCQEEIRRTGKRYFEYKANQYLLQAQLVKIEGEEYLICFKIYLVS